MWEHITSLAIAAMRNRTFLCVAIIVNAVAVMLAASEGIKFDLWDICELLMMLLVAVYLRVAEYDDFRPLIKGLLASMAFMTVIAHIFS
jgi:hypothetical protein